jgi:hypothetical protein
MLKDIFKSQKHGNKTHQNGIFECLYKITFNSQ